MMGEAKSRAAELAEDIQVGGLGGERQRESSQGSLAIQSGAPQAGSGQKVSERLQAKFYCDMYRTAVRGIAAMRSSRGAVSYDGANSVSASGTTEISTGRVPSSSPSASA